MSRFLIALDPGTRHMGAAWFVDGELTAATHIQPDVDLRSKGAVTWLNLGSIFRLWVLQQASETVPRFQITQLPLGGERADFAFEMMVIRKRGE